MSDSIIRKTVEAWAAELGTEPRCFRAAKAYHRWPEGRELTQVEYLEAVHVAVHAEVR